MIHILDVNKIHDRSLLDMSEFLLDQTYFGKSNFNVIFKSETNIINGNKVLLTYGRIYNVISYLENDVITIINDMGKIGQYSNGSSHFYKIIGDYTTLLSVETLRNIKLNMLC